MLAKAAKTPPSSDEDIQRARTAFATLTRHKHKGIVEIAWKFAVDTRQNDSVRGGALYSLRDSPDSPTHRVRNLAVAIVKDSEQTRGLRMHAAFVLERARFADDRSRAVLEAVLLRPGDDHIVQRSCLGALAATAPLKTIRRLLLRRELYEHAYYGIRVDVCTGLAALHVRDRRALEILCSLLLDEDENDWQLLVPQEAWLSLWSLSGRVHGVARKDIFSSRPDPAAGEANVRRSFRHISILRAGVSRSMVASVKALTHSNPTTAGKKDSEGKRVPPIRNDKGLRAAADAYRNDFDDIVREWKTRGGR